MTSQQKTVMVTGAGGYIGSVLVPKLLASGYRVKAVDRFFFGLDTLDPHPNLTILREDSRFLPEAWFGGVDAVIDLVAISNDPSGESFSEATWQINHASRVRTAGIAKQMGVSRYILPSSCSIYGFQENQVDEKSKTNPLTTYAKANERAEHGVLPLADQNFTAVVMRQATIFGYSRRMRLDLAINGMVYGAYTEKKLPLMRDGKQYRPMLHVQDTTDVMLKLLVAPSERINGQIFNIGSAENNCQLGPLGEMIARVVGARLGQEIPIQWYGEVDHRSYYVNFEKIEKTLEWKAQWNAEKGANEFLDVLSSGQFKKTSKSITLEWYQQLAEWDKRIHEVRLHGGILNI